MTRYRWRMREDGVVLVQTSPEALEAPPVLAAEHRPAMDEVVRRWEALAQEVSGVYAIPDGWLLAMIKRESNGDPAALRREPNGWTGVGLLQITHPSLKRQLSDAEVFVPRVNLTIGAKYTKELIAKYGRNAPMVFAAFNAGSVRESEANPWGMVQTPGHVSSEVAALNYYLLRSSEKAAERAAAIQFSTRELLGDDFGRPELPEESRG